MATILYVGQFINPKVFADKTIAADKAISL